MKSLNAQRKQLQARGAMLIVVLLLGMLVFAFFRAQVLRSSTWVLQSDSNRLRALAVPAPRGTIYDRNGRVIADNTPAYSVSLFPAPRDSIARTLERLRPYISISDARAESILRDAPFRRQPLLVKADASYEEVAALEERRFDFPGIFMEMRPKRRYNAGPAVAHVLGHVGEISATELTAPRFLGYTRGMTVGKAGIEREYEAELQGIPGIRYVEVDAVGRIVGSFQRQATAVAEPGTDIHLNVDLDLMEWIHEIFPDTMNGAVVALDVADGGVLALYSSPTFDPNDFVGGIDPDVLAELNSDPGRPQFNRTVMGLYPPASTWKLASAAIALELGVVTPDDHMPVSCTGGIWLAGRYARCWNPEGHGRLNLAEALRDSCNVYFYQLGLRVGLDRLVEEGSRIGFSEQCGIDLPQESRGIFPTDLTTFWEERFGTGYRPQESEVLSLVIGQGPNSQTPLKMAQFYGGLARQGSAPAPRIRREGEVPEDWTMQLTEENLAALLDGLRQVFRPGGTGYLSSLEHWDIIGKTGTAQNAQNPDIPHAWFAGMAGPWGADPEIVVVVIVEAGESGSAMAAPIGARVADFYLRKKHDIPQDSIRTLRDHYRVGRPAPWSNR
ncbi:MAG: penicillin-binding protein 2 [Gemmatimonadota bacterium]